MTGMNVRVERDMRWQSIEVEKLTDAELDGWVRRMRDSTPFDGWNWAMVLIRWIRENVKPEDVARAARVDRFVREVDEGLRSLPDEFQGEAREKMLEVLAAAMRRIDDAPLPRPRINPSLLPGPGRDGH
jgi:hypothetical protein